MEIVGGTDYKVHRQTITLNALYNINLITLINIINLRHRMSQNIKTIVIQNYPNTGMW